MPPNLEPATSAATAPAIERGTPDDLVTVCGHPSGGDRLTLALRTLSALGMLAIAGIAAVVSYSHIHDVVLTHGESETAARLIPLSVDGLILVASMTALAERRAGRPRSPLAIIALALGATASLTANIAHAQPTAIGRIAAAWSPVALAIGHELLLRQLHPRDGSAVADTAPGSSSPAGNVPALAPSVAATADGQDDMARHELPECPMPDLRESLVLLGRRQPTKKAQLAALVGALPSHDHRTAYQLARDLAPLIHLHEGTARRYLAALRNG
jgi:hypothetical protein